MKVLLTGGSGFLGSHMAEVFLVCGYELLLTKRITSDLYRCSGFADKVAWVDTDNPRWSDIAIQFSPDVIVNCAWDGVGVDGRGSWDRQIQNLQYQQQLLDLALACGCKKMIGIGSQAEYGQFCGIKREDEQVDPNSAYGATKLAAQIVMKAFCEQNNIKWYWFRLFSVFGEREGVGWLIPSVIKKMVSNERVDLTECEQKYSYVYVKDAAAVVARGCVVDASNGIYNISSMQARSLKEILENIRSEVRPLFQLNFGAIPYRSGQSMHNQGDMAKTNAAFGCMDEANYEQLFTQTINYYKQV